MILLATDDRLFITGISMNDKSFIHKTCADGIALCAYALQIGKQKFEINPEEIIFKLFD